MIIINNCVPAYWYIVPGEGIIELNELIIYPTLDTLLQKCFIIIVLIIINHHHLTLN